MDDLFCLYTKVFYREHLQAFIVRKVLVIYNKMIYISVFPNCEDKTPPLSLDTYNKDCTYEFLGFWN